MREFTRCCPNRLFSACSAFSPVNEALPTFDEGADEDVEGEGEAGEEDDEEQ